LERKTVLLLASILVLQFFLVAGLWHYRPLPDEGRYLTTGWMISQGKVPFRDTFSPKMPGLEFALAGIFTVFGPSLLAARLFVAIAASAIVLLVFFISRKAFGEKPALIASLFFSLWSTAFSSYWAIIEPFTALFSAIAVLFAFRFLFGKASLGNAFAFGFFLGLEVIFKQTMLPFALFMAAAVLAIGHFRGTKPGLRAVLAWVLGLAAMPLVFLVYLLSTGAFPFFVEAMLFPFLQLENFGVVAIDSKFLIAIAAFIAVPVALIALWKRPSIAGKRHEVFLFLAWFVFSFSNALPFRSCCIHLLPALPAASIFAGLLISDSLGQGGKEIKTKPLALFSALLLFLSFFAGGFFFSAFFSGDYSFSSLEGVASFVRANTGSNDTIMVFPASPELFFLAQRMPSSRQFVFFDPCPERCQQPVLEELFQNKPELLVYFSASPDYAASNLAQILEFREKNYGLLKVIELERPLYKTYGYAFIFRNLSS